MASTKASGDHTPSKLPPPERATWLLKASLLTLLAVQNGSLNLYMRLSRMNANDSSNGEPGFAKTTLVVTVESLKIVGSVLLLICLDCGGNVSDAMRRLKAATLSSE